MFRRALCLGLLLAAQDAFAKANGVDSRAYFPPLGCGSTVDGEQLGCHANDATPALTVTIAGPAQLGTGPQDSGLYTISIPQGFAGLKGAGANVALLPSNTGCQLEPFSSNLGFQNELGVSDPPVLSHEYVGDPPPTALEGVWSYQFLVLNCTNPGPLTLLAAMNAFDGSGDETGDEWNDAELAVTVPEAGAPAGALAAFVTLAAFVRRRARR